MVGNSKFASFAYSFDAHNWPVTRNDDRFAYNDRDEITSAVIGTNRINRAYDTIGNHVFCAYNAATNFYANNSPAKARYDYRDRSKLLLGWHGSGVDPDDVGMRFDNGEWKIFKTICYPLCKSAIASVIILLFIDYWNMVEQPLILLSDAEQHPLSVFLSKINTGEIGLAFAIATIGIANALGSICMLLQSKV